MSATKKCPECGTELPIDLPPNVCPKCLLKVGLGSQPEPGGAATVLAPQPPVAPGALPLPGHQFGHYRIVRLLGKGGMGAVYEAQDLESGRRVALKVLGHSLDSPEARKRFLREGRLAASINHPNSVYVYGTEEIEGAPAIAMEFVAGGTLQERVQTRGPLPVPEAVDAMLQIIAGLEAAQAIGILHRDIKPANCFVDSDGTVKVGDFGLSISTAARGETNLTVSGSFMGTPAFSSPEQLRGEELNVRSDIYAAGVTLYYLLTGRTPFQSENMVQLLATVLERAAESPAKWRREIPKGLCQAVVRCLEKQPAERFKTYADLREALLPFSSTAATAATLGLRFLAGCIDLLLVAGISILTTLLLFQDWEAVVSPDGFRNPKFLLSSLAGSIFWLLYYGVTEGIWGASLGKAICRLRVVGSNRNFPGVPRALLRAAIYSLPPTLPGWLFFAFGASGSFSAPIALKSMAVSLSYYSILALLFATARRKNGFAGLHDLLSNTRVILKSAYLARPGLEAVEERPASPEAAPQIGPYHVLEVLGKNGPEEILLGYDTRLLRKVWIRKLPIGAPPVAPNLRNLARVGRLRWLNGNRSAKESWDAYEAVPGKPLLSLISERQPWSRVRFWLLDLAEEVNAGLKDNSLPAILELDRVWITVEGRAKLLDFPAPGMAARNSQPERIAAAEVPPICFVGCDLQDFLSQVAVGALEGRAVGAGEARRAEVAVPLPLHARNVLTELQAGLAPNLLVDLLKPLLNKVAFVSRWRRLGLIAGCFAFPLMAAVGLLF